MQVGVRLLDGHSAGQRREDGEDVQGVLPSIKGQKKPKPLSLILFITTGIRLGSRNSLAVSIGTASPGSIAFPIIGASVSSRSFIKLVGRPFDLWMVGLSLAPFVWTACSLTVAHVVTVAFVASDFLVKVVAWALFSH